MEYINILSFIALGIASFLFFLLKKDSLKDVVSYLLAIAVSLLISSKIVSEEGNQQVSYAIILFLSLNFVLSRLKMLQEIKFSWIIPILLSVGSFAFISTNYSFNGYDFTVNSIPLLALPIVGTLIIPLARLKSKLLSSWIGLTNTEELEQVFVVFFVGFSAFLGSFFASDFGILCVALGFLAHSFYRNDRFKNVGVVLLLLSLSHFFASLAELETVELTLGKTLEGIFFGAFAVLFLYVLASSKKHLIAALTFGLLIVLFVLFGVLLLFTQKSDLGGMDAFIGVLVGISIALSLFPTFLLAETLAAFVIGGGMFFAPMLINQEEKAALNLSVSPPKEIGTENKIAEVSPFDLKGVSLDSIIGFYQIDPATAKVNFQLGPKGGITKGAFKSFTGEITIAPSIQNSSFAIRLPLSQLTTFNKYRDESLLAPEYFGAVKFPEMTYKSSSLSKTDDGYELKGKFTMLGVSKDLPIQLKYIGMVESKDKKVPVLIGKSSIDRTLFGMKPDSKEGNVVAFEFKVDLIKK
jgi:polyisoprenoid-binding protein YceI